MKPRSQQPAETDEGRGSAKHQARHDQNHTEAEHRALPHCCHQNSPVSAAVQVSAMTPRDLDFPPGGYKIRRPFEEAS